MGFASLIECVPGRAAPALRAGTRALADLLLPRVCGACRGPMGGHERGLICGRCWARLHLLPAPACPRCGHPRASDSCRWCALLPPFVRAARSVCWATAGSGLAIVHALKYDGWWRIADAMAERMARLPWPLDVVEERAAVVPVPLAASRQRQRGYNQSECVARALASYWGVPVRSDALERSRETTSQTRLAPEERVRNVLGAFRATSSARNLLSGAHVVLVDDVVTTAATLNACAAALHERGIRIVSYVTFGRAPAIGDRP